MRLLTVALAFALVSSAQAFAGEFTVHTKCWPRSDVHYVDGKFEMGDAWMTIELGHQDGQSIARVTRLFGLLSQDVALEPIRRGLLKETYRGEGFELVIKKFTLDRDFPAPISKLRANLTILPELGPDTTLEVVCGDMRGR